jgi:MFS family permease
MRGTPSNVRGRTVAFGRGEDEPVRLTFPPLLRETPFRRFWIGQTISMFGDQVTSLALPVVAVLYLGAQAEQMGLLTAVGLLPHLLFSLPAGVWLDRVRVRRRLMILADIGRAAAIAFIPLAFFLNVLSLPLLFGVAFVVGTLSVVFDISWNTVYVAVTKRDQYIEANSLLNGSRSLSSVGGPAIGGILVQVLTAPLALVADALSYLGSALFLGRTVAPEAPIERDPGSVRSQLATGLRFIARDAIVSPTLLSVGILNFFNYCFQALLYLYVLDILKVEPGVFGFALGAGAVGAVIGAITASGIGRRLGLGRAYALGLILFPLATILIPVAAPDAPTPVVLALLFLAEFGSGFGVMILDINVGAMLVARTPDRIRGRANGAFRFINMGIRPIGATVGGVLGGLLGVRETLFVVTILQLAGVFTLIGSPILKIRDMPEPAEEPQRPGAPPDAPVDET